MPELDNPPAQSVEAQPALVIPKPLREKKSVLVFLGVNGTSPAAQFLAHPSKLPEFYDVADSPHEGADFSPLAGKKLYLWPVSQEHLGTAQEAAISLSSNKIVYLVEGEETPFKVLEGSQDEIMGWIGLHSALWTNEKEELFLQDKALKKAKELSEQPIEPDDYKIWSSLGLQTNPAKIPFANTANVLKVLEQDKRFEGSIWYDEFYRKVMTNAQTWDLAESREWTGTDDVRLQVLFQRQIKLHKIGKDAIRDGVELFAKQHPRNEPKDWMRSLIDNKIWDGVDRLTEFFPTYYGSSYKLHPTRYLQAVGRNFWISMVRRIFKPGCVSKYMVVLESMQDMAKSKSLSIIGGKWYLDCQTKMEDDVRFTDVIQGKMLIELSELSSFRKQDNETIKSCLSRLTDKCRLAYERRSEEYPRQSTFVGTTNNRNYLMDEENVRYWPVAVGKVDFEALAADRTQLFAQAVHEYLEGVKGYIMPQPETKQMQDSRRDHDEWEQVIASWLEKDYIEKCTTKQIYSQVFDNGQDSPGRLDKATQNRISRCMRVLKWERKSAWSEGKSAWVWTPRPEPENPPAPEPDF